MADLPPLPEPIDAVRAEWRGEYEFLRSAGDYYTADQMREYAAAAVAAEREACAKACDMVWYTSTGHQAKECAAAIRARAHSG